MGQEERPTPRGLLDRIFGALRRETSGAAFIPQVDGLRFFAIAAVILTHVNASVYDRLGSPEAQSTLVFQLTSVGYVGVQLFFVISGFVLGLPFATQRLRGGPGIRMGRYFARRLTRLEPPYVVSLLVLAAYMLLRHKWDAGSPRHFFATLFYLHSAIFHEQSSINVVTWSLEIEVQFYIAAPLLASVFRIENKTARRAVLCALVVAGSALQALLPDRYSYGPTLLHQSQYFWVGFLLVDAYLVDWIDAPRTREVAFDVVSTIAWVGVFAVLVWPPAALAPHFAEPWLMFVAYLAAFRGRVWRRIVGSRLVYTIGGMCYTLYLYHYTIVGIVSRLTARLLRPSASYGVNLAIQSLLIVPVVLVLCSVLFAVFEKPFMRRDWWKRKRPAPVR